MIFSLYQTALLFFIYSFLGWCVEVAFVAITLRKVQNRGFLNAPVCPIYGIGMLGVLILLEPVKESWILLFLGGMAICSGVELFGGWILDKIFHMRWWDYSDKKFNLGGYICLAFSIMWGIAVVFAVKFVHPFVFMMINKMPKILGVILICILIAAFIVDMIVTLKKLVGIKKSLGTLDQIAEELNNIGEQLKDVVGNSAITVADKAEEQKDKFDERTEENREKWANASEAAREKLVEMSGAAIGKIADVSGTTMEKLSGVGESTKEKIADVGGATMEKLSSVSESTKEKIAGVSGNTKEKILGQKEELERKRDALIETINKYSKKKLNNLPKLNKSGKSINIKEYVNSLRRK